MNFNTIKQQIEMIIMKNRLLYSLLLVSILYLVLFYFNFTAYIGDYFEEEKYGFCMHCNRSVYVEHAKVLELYCIELLSGDGSPYSILSANDPLPTCLTIDYCFGKYTNYCWSLEFFLNVTEIQWIKRIR